MASPGMLHPIPWVLGVQLSLSLGILPEVHHGCTHICSHFLWTCPSTHASLYLPSIPDWTFWIDFLNLARFVTFFGVMWMVDSDFSISTSALFNPCWNMIHSMAALPVLGTPSAPGLAPLWKQPVPFNPWCLFELPFHIAKNASSHSTIF